MGRTRSRTDIQSEAKARLASKLADIRGALVRAGYDTIAKQAAVLRVGRSTAWLILNRDNRVGPSANVLKRILSSPNLPRTVRRKVEEYVRARIGDLYWRSERQAQRFRDNFAAVMNQSTEFEVTTPDPIVIVDGD